MLEMQQNFTSDFDALAAVLHPDYSGPPISCSRFGDGEYAIMNGMAHCAKSDGWHWGGQDHDLRNLLFQSLTAGSELDNYYVGISAANHHPKAHEWYARKLSKRGVPASRVTFASLFIFANYERFRRLHLGHCCIIGRGSKDMLCDIPHDPADPAWPKLCEELAAELVESCHPNPILVSAGPWSGPLVLRYWQLTTGKLDQRQTIIDVGSAIDEITRGRRTRRYHDPDHPQRNWIPRMEIGQNAELPS